MTPSMQATMLLRQAEKDYREFEDALEINAAATMEIFARECCIEMLHGIWLVAMAICYDQCAQLHQQQENNP